MNTQNLFIRFLKENNIYQEYFNEIENHNLQQFHVSTKSRQEEVLRNLLTYEPLRIIDYSFHWSATLRGRKFWEAVDLEWGRVCKYYNLE